MAATDIRWSAVRPSRHLLVCPPESAQPSSSAGHDHNTRSRPVSHRAPVSDAAADGGEPGPVPRCRPTDDEAAATLLLLRLPSRAPRQRSRSYTTPPASTTDTAAWAWGPSRLLVRPRSDITAPNKPDGGVYCLERRPLPAVPSTAPVPDGDGGRTAAMEVRRPLTPRPTMAPCPSALPSTALRRSGTSMPASRLHGLSGLTEWMSSVNMFAQLAAPLPSRQRNDERVPQEES